MIKKTVNKVGDIILANQKERKKSILIKSKDNLKHLNPIKQRKISKFLEELLENCPYLKNEELSKILTIITAHDLSNQKYEKIINAKLDNLSEITEKWDTTNVYLVLNELYERLELIRKIELLIDNPDTNEVQQLQLLFKEALWILHPKYEGTTRYISNQIMNKLIADFLNYPSEKKLNFVVLDNSTIGTFSSYSYKEDSNVIDGFDEILIIELKKGGSNIGSNEMDQAVKYAKEIKKHGNVTGNTKIIAYVLGHTISPDEQEPRIQGNISIYAKQYQLIIKTAKDRTFDLINKIKDVKGITDIGDGEINEILNQNTLD